MPKPVYATAQELEDAVKKLEGQITACQNKIGPAVKGSETTLKAEITKVADNVTANAKTTQEAVERCGKDSKAFTDQKVGGLRDEIMGLLPTLESKINTVDSSLTTKIDGVNRDVRQALADELKALCDRIDKEFEKCRADFQSADQAEAKVTAANLTEQRAQLDASISNTAQEADRLLGESRKALEKALQKAVDTQSKSDAARDEKSTRSESEIWLKLDRLDELLKELDEKSAEATENLRQEAHGTIKELKDHAVGRLDGHDEEGLKIRTAMLEVENLATRRVDWIIKDASKRLRPNSASKASLHTSWFSPKFDMAGAHGLQLELQLFRQSDIGVEGESSGDVAIFLWACKGMNLVYKLFCGGKSQTCEKVFNGRVPYGTSRYCWLKEQINKEDDTLKIGVEILEAVRELEHVLKPIPPPTAEELVGASQVEKELAEKMALKQVPGSLMFRRHVNNRILDQVKSQVDAMRSRMVRRVEWRLENAGKLRKCFPANESMCSASFNAAGVEGLQLIFYPNGYNGATDGFCSLYLYGPAGATLKCNLYVGDQKRDANHTYDVAGAFGRTNFCRFDAGVEQVTDTITLALEIDEAHQDMAATVAHPKVAPGDARNMAQIEGSASAPIESTVKLSHASGQVGSGGKSKAAFEERRVLPSLWTAKSLADKAGKNAEFHSFDELGQTTSKGGFGRRTRGGGGDGGDFSPSSPTTSLQLGASQSLPGFKDSDAGGYESTPLPKLTKSPPGGEFARTSSEWSVGTRSRGLGRGGKGVRSRSMAATSPMTSPDV
mmetsp:Transcript_25357/g.45933  ORF Transcript_25357/g.45933 Transcript_25357/m.45933 type:complete len:783 (-) Transcript_25357:254-2602(-)|eukprot:CAMPEP_0197662940 /NCGR_PEP_ID=MMETSP1338-20131121/55438_1 /TAXON_ID=43686 ORGANISM="Pelagodinium beii, Strain RCC1491" /NCGR_SAMPLE_ID=MMETSP1338 /ASSEMBLY_ACC=CAM_ASM_000754 /LENGTH=782 /DNA_ID=CAMNT_0043241057 /DNA_START=62 /DNA_END=2410 /DNA_ORIENTATION=-